jgi:hypothetical protein
MTTLSCENEHSEDTLQDTLSIKTSIQVIDKEISAPSWSP